MITVGHMLVLASFLFVVGIIGALTRKSAIIVFLSIELALNSVNLVFLTFSRYFGNLDRAGFAKLAGCRASGHAAKEILSRADFDHLHSACLQFELLSA